MYAITYGFFYLLSLLPWRVLYFISDGFYGLVYYVIGYRKEVVMKNLAIAFPEKTETERIRIARDFYHNLIDNFIETLKLLSISEKEIKKRFACNDWNILNDLYPTGQKVQFYTAHYFNWEFANMGASLASKYPFVVVYMPISNKVIDRLLIKLRSRFGTVLIPATDFRSNFQKYVNDTYAMALVADQSAGNPSNAYWAAFFGRKAPFVKGPEKGARLNNTAVIYGNFYKVKRGYYRVDLKLITTEPRTYPEGALTRIMITEVEASVRKNPANYLWSHRRWKHEFNEEQYGDLVI